MCSNETKSSSIENLRKKIDETSKNRWKILKNKKLENYRSAIRSKMQKKDSKMLKIVEKYSKTDEKLRKNVKYTKKSHISHIVRRGFTNGAKK